MTNLLKEDLKALKTSMWQYLQKVQKERKSKWILYQSAIKIIQANKDVITVKDEEMKLHYKWILNKKDMSIETQDYDITQSTDFLNIKYDIDRIELHLDMALEFFQHLSKKQRD